MAGTTEDSWSASLYNKAASFVYSDAYTQPVLDLLDPKPNQRILDLGCGTGELTCRLQDLVGESGTVLGVDASENMLEKARNNGVRNSFCCDIQKLVFPEEYRHLPGTFDAVFTNATLHWCKRDPLAVVKAAKIALRPGGKFARPHAHKGRCLSFTAEGVRLALHKVLKTRGVDPESVDPWYFPRPEPYAKILESEGFRIEHVSLNPRITPLPGTLTEWLYTFARNSALAGMSDEEANGVIQEVSDLCEPDMKDGTGGWAIMYVRLRFHATAAV